MITNNIQIYKVLRKQLATLRKLASMSLAIDDTEGAKVIQAAEIVIERRIQINSMNLSALEYLEKLIDRGHDYADAEWRTTQCYPIDPETLRVAYDD